MRIRSSLFVQWYMSVVAVLLLIGGVFLGALHYADEQWDYDDFYVDTAVAAQPLMRQWLATGDLPQPLLTRVGHETMFEVRYLSRAQLPAILNNKVPLMQRQGGIVYAQDQGGYLSVRYLGEERVLLIGDREPDPMADDVPADVSQQWQRELRDDNQRTIIIQFSVLLLLVLIAMVMVLMVNRVRRYIDGLVDASVAWSKGDFSVHANDALPAPLDTLATGFNQMARELDQYAQEQAVLMNAVSHELRTPLSKIQLAMEMLVRQQPGVDTNPLFGDLQRYHEELASLVNQTLTFSTMRNDKGTFGESDVNLSALLLARVGECKLKYPQKAVVLDLAEDVRLWGRPMEIQMLCDNVLNNALHYADKQVQVYLCRVQGMTHGVVRIEDDGPGIPRELRGRITQPFYRTDTSRNQHSGGFGLGLAIVDTIVQRHQGRVTFYDAAVGGLGVKITLPLYTAMEKE